MKLAGWLLGVMFAITALRLFVQAAFMLILLVLLVCLVRRPGDTLKVLLFLILLGAFAKHPEAGLLFGAALLAASLILPKRRD